MSVNLRRSQRIWRNAHAFPSWLLIYRFLLIGILPLSLWHTTARASPPRPVNDPDQLPNKPATTAYARKVTALIKTTWTHLIEKRTDLADGTVVIHLSVDRQGNVVNPQLVTGALGEPLARSALHVVLSTQLPAMPDAATKELEGKRLSFEITFDYSPAPEPTHEPTSR